MYIVPPHYSCNIYMFSKRSHAVHSLGRCNGDKLSAIFYLGNLIIR